MTIIMNKNNILSSWRSTENLMDKTAAFTKYLDSIANDLCSEELSKLSEEISQRVFSFLCEQAKDMFELEES